jgi:hypothetical protein
MKYIISTAVILTTVMAILIVHGCGGSSERGGSAVNQVSSGMLSSVVEKSAAVTDQGRGSIRGVVNKRLLSDSSCTGGNAVYVFEGRDVVPDDIDGIIADPADYVIVKFDTGSGQYQYRTDLLNAGDYTLAFTCQAGEDNPDVDNYNILFSGIRNVTVVSGRETIQHLFRS